MNKKYKINKGRGWYNDIPQHRLAGYGIPTSYAQSELQKFHGNEKGKVPPEELYPIEYQDTMHPSNETIKDMFQLFWWCNVNDNYEWFDFDDAFDVVENMLEEKLGNHNRLPNDEQWSYLKQMSDYEPYMFASLMENHIGRNMTIEQRKTSKMYEDINDDYIESVKTHENQNPLGLKETLRSYGYDDWYDYESIEFMIDELGLERSIINAFIDMEMFKDRTYDRIRNTYDELKGKEYDSEITFFDEIIDMYHHSGNIWDKYADVPTLREDFEEEYL